METKIITFTDKTSEDNSLEYAAQIIKNGGLVVFPTETVYGLGADATNSEATSNIYKAKGRPSDNPLIIHIANPDDAEMYAFTNSVYYLLAEKFMPGPITVIMKSKSTVPLTTRGNLDTVAVRCPINPIARKFISLCNVAVAAPSANLSGSPSPTMLEHVIKDMSGRVDAIIDGGDCEIGLESTIVKINDDNSLTLLRPGKITKEEIEGLGIVVSIAGAVTDTLKENETAISPGMKYKHYAPKAPLILFDGTKEKLVQYINNARAVSDRIAVIAYDGDVEYILKNTQNVDVISFGNQNDELVQAHLLFKLLRKTDEGDYKVIYAPLPQKRGVGLALYNRMIRAAAYNILRL